VHLIVKAVRQIPSLTGIEVEHVQAVEICLVSIAFHAEPRETASIGRERRLDVVARHSLCQVCCRTARQVHQEKVRIRAPRVLDPGQGLCRVHDASAIRAPGDLLTAPERRERRIYALTGHQVARFSDRSVLVRCYEQVAVVVFMPGIPMPVHEVVGDSSLRLRQIRVQLDSGQVELYGRRERDSPTVR
jgi:hypothetical protein